MNASYRLNRLLSRPRRQKHSKWIDATARATDFTRIRFFNSGAFYALIVGAVMAAMWVGTHFHMMTTVASFVYPILGSVAAICGFQGWHMNRVGYLGEGQRTTIAKHLEDLKILGCSEDQIFVNQIADMLQRERFEDYHVMWWNGVQYALQSRLDELNTTVEVQTNADTVLDNLNQSSTPKHLKV